MKTIIEFDQVCKTYRRGEVEVEALKDVGFHIEDGEFVILFGASGAGKSTLLNILGGIDRPSSGKVMIDGEDLSQFSESELTAFRREKIGFVFQFYNLMANLTVDENIGIATEHLSDAYSSVEILSYIGLREKKDHFPSQLSGGEQQRVAIARAVAKKPKFLLCDEPTGALDTDSGEKVLHLLETIHRKHQRTVILITHNSKLLPMADKVIYLQNGQIKNIRVSESRKSIQEMEWS